MAERVLRIFKFCHIGTNVYWQAFQSHTRFAQMLHQYLREGTVFLAITIAMMFAMSQLRIETGFKKQLPLKHEYMQTFLQYEKDFGGANRVLVALVARDGNMFDQQFFEVEPSPKSCIPNL